jgi:septal ring factor EnvC (AmiA/AmiB activator)
MSHDDAAMYERAIREGREKETKGKDIRKMNCQEMSDEGVMCDFCNLLHPSDYECDYSTISNMILDVDRKVNDQWEMNYKSIENISKRLSKVEDDIISLYRKLEFNEDSLKRNWKDHTELSQRLNKLEENMISSEEIISMVSKDIGKLFRTKFDVELAGELHSQIEERLEKLEGYMEMEDRVTASDILLKLARMEDKVQILIADNIKSTQRYVPYKCPVCDGKSHTHRIDDEVKASKNFEFYREYASCHACEGKGIVWR